MQLILFIHINILCMFIYVENKPLKFLLFARNILLFRAQKQLLLYWSNILI